MKYNVGSNQAIEFSLSWLKNKLNTLCGLRKVMHENDKESLKNPNYNEWQSLSKTKNEEYYLGLFH